MASDHWTFRPDARLQYQAYESATCATSSPKVRTVATGRYVYLSTGTRSADLLTAVCTSSKPPRNPSRTLGAPDWATATAGNRTSAQSARSDFEFIVASRRDRSMWRNLQPSWRRRKARYASGGFGDANGIRIAPAGTTR